MGSCFFENCAFAVCKGRILAPSCTPATARNAKHCLGEGREGGREGKGEGEGLSVQSSGHPNYCFLNREVLENIGKSE